MGMPGPRRSIGCAPSRRAAARGLAFVLCAGAATACLTSKPFILHGDASSVEIGYAGDPRDAVPLARQHCAQFEKDATLLQSSENIAFFDCVRR
jgi:hypothetical protein